MAKGVFTDAVSDDIDDLLPSRLPEPPVAGPAEEAVTSAPRPRGGPSAPTVQVDPTIHKQLRRLTARERGRNPSTARTYTQVVLDAIETHADELATHWQSVPAPRSNGGLFSRQKVSTSRRRRHPDPPARVPLTGLNPDDLATLDKLVADWNAGSRSALVEEALRRYLLD